MIAWEDNSSLGLGKRCVPCVLATPRGDKLQEARLRLLGGPARKGRTMDRREESLEKKEGDFCLEEELRIWWGYAPRTKPTREKPDQPRLWTLAWQSSDL